MKVAVSIPDPLFKSAESLATKLKKPGSRRAGLSRKLARSAGDHGKS